MTQRLIVPPTQTKEAPVLSPYHLAEAQFDRLLLTPALDQKIGAFSALTEPFECQLDAALKAAYQSSLKSDEAHLFLQRILYRINRLKLFWYDDFKSYENEDALYLRTIREKIETAWQSWQLQTMDLKDLKIRSVASALKESSETDLNPDPSRSGIYFRDEMSLAGYKTLLKIASLDGLVEASQLSRVLGGVSNEVQSILIKLLLEEYGGGRMSRKHSTYFETMLCAFDLDTVPEAYFDCVPWRVLAGINQSFLLTERKRYFLRYIGGLLYTEIATPSGFRHYAAAARRLALPQEAIGYWDLHIKEDERHGRWMLEDIALPLAERYPDDAWELLWGYEQQKRMAQSASEAIAVAVRNADDSGVS